MIKSGWKIIPGKIPILLSAPHNFPQLRNNVYKFSDVNTGYLVEQLCKRTACWGTISTEIQNDPNYDLKSPFRMKLKEIVTVRKIKILIDVHGRRSDYPYLIDAIPNRHFKNKYLDIIQRLHIKDFDNKDQIQITKDLDIPAVELEIRRDGREINTTNIKNVLEELEILILSLYLKSTELS